MTSLATLVHRASMTWDPALERAVFGTDDANEIAAAIEALVGARCGPIADGVFYHPGVGVVAGLRLVDGSEVVVKVHRWNVSVARLAAVQEVQALLAGAGIPAPRPIGVPEPLAAGIATIEELRRGERADGRDPAVRRALAEGLHVFVSTAAPLIGHVDVGTPPMLRPPEAPLWFEPHDVRFDFHGTSAGAEWIDKLAESARRRLERSSRNVIIGHFDWRVENLAFRGTDIAAIYDWDSVAAAAEPVVVANAAAQFTADWSRDESDPLPRVDEMKAFVEDYERARGTVFEADEREALVAANLFLCAYGARCQHSDQVHHPEIGGSPTNRWWRLLRERGERGLID